MRCWRERLYLSWWLGDNWTHKAASVRCNDVCEEMVDVENDDS